MRRLARLRMEQYTYRPLRDAPDSTRLLQIQPGVQGSEIHCLLFDYTIDQTRASGPYEALSYAWGDPTERQRIYVQDVQHQASISDVLLYLDVTTNLYAALQRLRDNIFPRLMWVDALCIDQENLQERATQVQFMVKIYLYATRVIVWLGAEADDSTSALVAIEDTAVRARQSQISGDEWAQFSDGDSLSPIEEDCEAIERLLARPWFRRIWVIQEVAAARQLLVTCGPAELTGATFVRGLHELQVKNIYSFKELKLHFLSMMLWETPQLQLDASDSRRLDILPLADLLENFYMYNASEQLDRVFALLGICRMTNLSIALPQPDYTKDWFTVMNEVVRHILGSSTKTTAGCSDDQVIITGRGWPIGQFKASKSIHGVRRIDPVMRSCFSGPVHGQVDCRVRWGQGSRLKNIAPGDILWQMDGAPSPCVIRFCDDHFVIVVISEYISNLILDWGSEHIEMQVHDVMNPFPNRHKRITLVWNLRVPHREFDQHPFRDRTELHKNANERRLLDCALIFDHFNDRDELCQILKSDHLRHTSRHANLLRLACSQWSSYQWLKKYIAFLHWALYALSLEEPTVGEDLLLYWKEEGSLPYGILEIESLLAAQSEQQQSFPNSELHRPPIDARWDFGEHKHSAFVAAIDHRAHLSPNIAKGMIGERLMCNSRRLMRMMLANQRLPGCHNSTASDLLSVILARCRILPHLLEPYVLMYALLSELHQNTLHLSKQTIREIALHPEGDDVLSFLLAESYKDCEAIYSIIDVAIRAQCQPYKMMRPMDGRVTEPYIAESSASFHGLNSLTVAPWLHDNIGVLKIYVRDTGLCEMAHSTPNDIVMPTLLDVFSYTSKPDLLDFGVTSAQSRNMILRGIDQFFEEQRAVAQYLCSLPARGQVAGLWVSTLLHNEYQTSSTISNEIELLLPEKCIALSIAYWNVYTQISSQLEHKGRVRRVLECSMANRGWGPASPDYLTRWSAYLTEI